MDCKPETKQVVLSSTCRLVVNRWSWGIDVSLDYTEHSTDYWHSDTETSIEISKQDAEAIIALLQEAFGIGEEQQK